jgi:large subunit ribosomal protein L3
LREFRVDATDAFKRGDSLEATVFAPGDIINVTGTSKGKGFQGVVKRHGFGGHPSTHGHKDQLRMPGSIGAGGVQHVLKGRRMAGHMGDARVTVQNLEIVEVREGGIIAVKGAVPGARHAILEIRTV